MQDRMYLLDHDWLFHRGDIALTADNSHTYSYLSVKAGAAQGPAGKEYNTDTWEQVSVPHDYLADADFSENNLLSHGYRTRTNAWYRKQFTLDSSFRGKQLLLCFEGTAVNAEFYFNGSLMARSFSAYTETVFDITDRAYFSSDTPNTLAVYINGLATEGWWYEGSGIYRHVRLYVKDTAHIAHNGIFAKPILKPGTKNSWTVESETDVENSDYADTAVSVHVVLRDGDRIIADSVSKERKIPFTSTVAVKQAFSVKNPKRWDIDNPKLYTMTVSVLKDGIVTDTDSVKIGFRTVAVDADRGFLLNGKKLLLKGTCNHQDHAGVGVALPDSLQYYRIKRLKELGSNAYRCSHNLPAKEILDACDELGMIVIDENRRFETRREVSEYLDIMVRRDRNHPCIAFWSLFNEEPLQNTEEGARMFRRMKSTVLHLDDSRIITGAVNGTMEGASLEMDITGFNYNLHALEGYHRDFPNQPILGSENNSATTTRGCYRTDRELAHVLDQYDEQKVDWGQNIKETWEVVRRCPWLAGIFVWTGFDYRGEPSPFTWPSVSSQFGIMDTCGFPKESFYFNRACFVDTPELHLLPHWNWKKGETVRVMAATNCDEAELFLSGKSLGRKPASCCQAPEWLVPFSPGKLSAKGYRNGKCVAKDSVCTAGKPVTVSAQATCPAVYDDGEDTLIVNCCLKDARGRTLPTANHLLRFEVIGDGYVRGVGNGDPNSHESDSAPERHLYAGWCQVLITANTDAASLALRVSCDGLPDTVLPFEVKHRARAPRLTNQSDRSRMILRFGMTETTQVRPDPLVKIADNDMNTFLPVSFDGKHFMDFRNGFRLFRSLTDLEKGSYLLTLDLAACTYEIYVNGRKIQAEKLNADRLVQSSFRIDEKTKTDIRVLIQQEHTAYGGIRSQVTLSRTEEPAGTV